MVVGIRYGAEASVEQPFPFDCESCGYRGFAKATGTGSGSAASPLFIGMATAKESARRESKHEAKKDARLRIDIAPCPAVDDETAAWWVIFGAGRSDPRYRSESGCPLWRGYSPRTEISSRGTFSFPAHC